jgi:hypothetical protein
VRRSTQSESGGPTFHNSCTYPANTLDVLGVGFAPPGCVVLPVKPETAMSQTSISFVALIAATLLVGPAVADTTEDDVTWINQCIADNKKEGATEGVVRKYCVCMNNAMGNEETKSVTEWEKSHPDETKACDKEAGWK